MTFEVGVALFLLAVGGFAIVAAATNLESFMGTGKVGLISRFAGRLTARVLVGATGGVTALQAVAMLVRS